MVFFFGLFSSNSLKLVKFFSNVTLFMVLKSKYLMTKNSLFQNILKSTLQMKFYI